MYFTTVKVEHTGLPGAHQEVSRKPANRAVWWATKVERILYRVVEGSGRTWLSNRRNARKASS